MADDKLRTIGTIQGPSGEDINPLERVADKEDLESLTSSTRDIKWGAAKLFKGAQGSSKNKSIIGMAQANVFEFPVFVSDSVPLEYATATNTLLEQVYASYLQMAISKNPVVDYKQVRSRQNESQFAGFKTNTTKYLECVDLSFQKEACHNEIYDEETETKFEFDLMSIEDSDAMLINEAVDYQPLSEFDHYFQEDHTFETRGANGTRRSNAGEDNFNNPAVLIQHIISNPQNIRNLTDPQINRVANYIRQRQGNLPAAQQNRIDELTDRIRQGTIRRRDYTDLRNILTRMQGASYVDSIINRNPNTWDYDETQRVKDFFDASRMSREDAANRTAINDILQRVQDGQHITGEDQQRIKTYYDSLKVQSQAAESMEKRGASTTAIGDILDRSSSTWNTSEIEKVQKYFDAETTMRVRQADRESVDTILNKLKAGEDITAQEQKRLKDYYDTAISKGKSEESAESREVRDTRTRGQYYKLDNGQIIAPQSVIKKLTEKGINIEKSRVELDKLVKDLEDVERAELLINSWLNRDDSASGGMSVEQKHAKYGNSIDDLRANDILNDNSIKESNAKLLAEKVNAYHTFRDKYGVSPDEFEFKSKVEKEEREKRKERFEEKRSKAPEFIDENKLKKMNTMKPLMMVVTMSIMAKDGHVSHPMEYVVGVKTHSRIIKSSTLPEVVRYPLEEMNKATRNAKWRAGELKFFKDILFHIKEKKQTAIDSRDPNRKWYRRLYELAHMKGDGVVSKSISGKAYGSGLIANASVIISKSDVDHIEEVTKIDMLKPSNAKKFCDELFLMNFIVIDTDNESIKIFTPEINNDFNVQSLAAVNKQIAELDTAGTNTREIFKMLK